MAWAWQLRHWWHYWRKPGMGLKLLGGALVYPPQWTQPDRPNTSDQYKGFPGRTPPFFHHWHTPLVSTQNFLAVHNTPFQSLSNFKNTGSKNFPVV
jgi:hypothetical protein